MKFNIKYITSLVLGLLALQVVGQGDLPEDQMEFLDSYEVEVPETDRIKILPKLPEVKGSTTNLVYPLPTKLMTLSYEPPTIKPLSIGSKKLPPIYTFWGKAGFGTPLQPYVNLSYQKGRDDASNFGANAFYHANNNNDLEHQRHMAFGLSLDGDYYFPQGFAVGGYGGFKQENRYYYGYNHADTTYNEDDARQRVNNIEAGLRFYNTEINSGDIDYKVNLDFYWLKDIQDVQETGMDINASITKWFNDAHPLTVALRNELVSYDGFTDQSINIFTVAPNFLYNGDQFKAKIGASLAMNDSLRIFPDVEVSTPLLGNQLLVFAGWTGGSTAQSWKKNFNYNPFINSFQSSVFIRPRNENYAYGGVKGKIKVFDYEVRLGYKMIENQALFINDPTDTRKFLVIYDDMTAFHTLIKVNADIVKNFNVYTTLEFNTNSTDQEEKAWHIPVFEGNIGATYALFDNQLKFTVETFLANGVPYLITSDGSTENLGSLFDLTFKSEYQITDNFGVFLDLNNITSNKRERWFMYPNYGFNVLGGLTMKF